jgi:hypothetical protein
MKRITTMAMVAGLIAVFLGILPQARSSVGSNATNTSAYNATDAITRNVAEFLPLGVLILGVAAIIVGVNILGGR